MTLNGAAADARTTIASSGYPLGFLAAAGEARTAGTGTVRYRCEVLGLDDFQKEGLVTDVATGRAWRLTADEAEYLNGTDEAPAPLTHWAAGLHADVSAAIADAAARRSISLASLRVTLVEGFGLRGSFAKGEAVAVVGGIEWVIDADSDASDTDLRAVIGEGFSRSAAIAALTGTHVGTFALVTNGRPSPVHGVRPSAANAEKDPLLRHASGPTPIAGVTLSGALLSKSPGSGRSEVTLEEGPDGVVLFPVRVTGEIDLATGVVSSTSDFPSVGTSRWTIISDPRGRVAPTPLAYFSIGAAFCFHTQLARFMKLKRLPISQPRLVQTSAFVVGGAGRPEADAFDTHLFINGKVDAPESAALLSAALTTCYAHRSLAVEVEATHSVELRDKSS
jgi:uncharacterized OsmC-like protein